MNSHVKHCAVVLLTWIGATAAAEGVFRTLGDRPTLDLGGMYAPFEADSYRLAANVDTEASWSSGRLTVHTDELGLRCDKDRKFATRRNDVVDVLLLGDSQGFGNGVSFEHSIAGSVAHSAAEDGFRVANAAVGGHSAGSQLQLAQWLRQREGLKVRHYVLLVTPAMSQSGEFGNRAMVGDDGRLYDQAPDVRVRIRLWVKTNLVIYSRIRDALRNSGIGSEPTKELPFVFKFYESGTSEQSLRRSFASYIARFKRFAEADGARLHIVYVPLTLETEFESIQSAAESRGLAVDRDVPFRVSSSVADEFNLHFHSLRPVLDTMYEQKKPLHLRGDFHYDRELSVDCGKAIWTALKPEISLSKPISLSRTGPSHGE